MPKKIDEAAMDFSDSDNEDDIKLLNSILNKRPSRAVDKLRDKQRSIVDDALESSRQLCDSAYRVSTLQKESVVRDDEELRARAEDLSERFNKEKASDPLEGADSMRQDDLLSEERRSQLTLAIDIDQSTGWGLRSIIGFYPNRCNTIKFYSSEAESIRALKTILSSRNEKENLSTNLKKVLLTCIEQSVLNFFLQEESSIARVLKKDGVSFLNYNLFRWLKGTSQSAGLIHSQSFLQGVWGNLEALITDGFCPPQIRSTTMAEMAAELRVWVDHSSLNVEPGSYSVATDTLVATTRNVPGLVYWMGYWSAMLSNAWEPPAWEQRDTADCLCNLCLVGLDYSTASSQTTRGIRSELHRLIPALLDHVSTRLGDNDMNQWMDQCVNLVLDKLPTLGPGRKDTDDEIDQKAWICHSVLLQCIPMFLEKEQSTSPHILANKFRMKLAVGALDSLSDGKAIEKGIKRDDMNGELGELCSKAFSAATGGLYFLNSLEDYILEVAPLCPAVVECASAAYQSSCILLRLQNDSHCNYTKPQAKLVSDVLEHLDDQAHLLKKRMSGIITNPHIRRAEYHLSIWSQYYRIYTARARNAAGDGETIEHQTSLKFFFKTHQLEMESEQS